MEIVSAKCPAALVRLLGCLFACLSWPLLLQAQPVPSLAEQYRQLLQADLRNEYDEVISLGRALITRTDRYHPAYGKIIQAAQAAGRIESAQKVFEGLLQQSPPDPKGYYGLGLLAAERNQLAEAVDLYQKCLTAKPDFSPAFLALIEACKKLKRLDEAAGFLNFLSALHPRSSGVQFGLGYYYAVTNQTNLALAAFDLALQLDPHNPDACYRKCQTLYLARRNSEVPAAYAKCYPTDDATLDTESQQLFLNLIAANALRLNNYTEALRLFKRALLIARELGDTGYEVATSIYLASLHERQDQYVEALRVYQEAFELAKKARDSYSRINLTRLPGHIGRVYFYLGDFERADLFLKEGLLQAEKAQNLLLQSLLLAYLGDLCIAKNDWGAAVVWYTRAVAINRSLPDAFSQIAAHDTLAALYLQAGDHDKAETVIREGIGKARETFQYEFELSLLNRLGSLHLQRGEFAQAVTTYQETVEVARAKHSIRTQWLAYAGLAAAQRKLGQLERAQQAYRQAIELMESVRATLQQEDNRLSFWQDKVDVYRDFTALLWQLHQRSPQAGFDRQAFHYSERARSRALLDALHETPTRLEQRLSVVLQEQGQRLRARFSQAEADLRLAQMTAKPTLEALNRFEAELQNALNEHRRWQQEVRRHHPSYAQLHYTEPYTAEQVQQLLKQK